MVTNGFLGDVALSTDAKQAALIVSTMDGAPSVKEPTFHLAMLSEEENAEDPNQQSPSHGGTPKMFVSASTTRADASTSFSAIAMASRDKNCVLECFRAGEGLLTDSKEPLHLQLLWLLMVPQHSTWRCFFGERKYRGCSPKVFYSQLD